MTRPEPPDAAPDRPAAPPERIALRPLATLWQGPAWVATAQSARPRHLLLWTTRGQGRVRLCGILRGLSVHNAIFLPAGTPFAVEPGPQLSGTVLEIPRGQVADLPDDILHLRVRDTYAQSELTGLLEHLGQELDGKRDDSARAAAAWATLISVWLLRHGAMNDARDSAAARLVRAYVARIETLHAADQSIAAHAAALGVTSTHLTRCCSDLAGRSAARLLGERVHLTAARQLLDTDRRARDVAADLGFATAAYFTRAFQRHTGMTPGKFRKLHKNSRG